MGKWDDAVNGITAGIFSGGNGVVVDAYASAKKPVQERTFVDDISEVTGLLNGVVIDPKKPKGFWNL